MSETAPKRETTPSVEPLDDHFLQWEAEFGNPPATDASETLPNEPSIAEDTPEKPLANDEIEPLTAEQREAINEAFAALSNPGDKSSSEIATLIHGLPVEVTRSDKTHESIGWTIDRQYYDQETGDPYVRVQKLGEPDERGDVPTKRLTVVELREMQRRLDVSKEQDDTPTEFNETTDDAAGSTEQVISSDTAEQAPTPSLEQSLTPEQVEDFDNRLDDIKILDKSYIVGKAVDDYTVGALNKIRMKKAEVRNRLQDLNPNPKYMFLDSRVRAKENKLARQQTKLGNSYFGVVNKFNQWRHDKTQSRLNKLQERRDDRLQTKTERLERARGDVQTNNETHVMRIDALKSRALLASQNKVRRHLERSLRQSGMKRGEVFEAINKIPQSHMDNLARVALASKAAERESREADKSLDKVNTRLSRTERAILAAQETSASETQNAVDYRERVDSIEASLPEHREELEALIAKREALSDDDPSSNGLDGMIAERQNAIDQLAAEIPKLREAALAADQKAKELSERATTLEAQREELRSERPSAVELQEAKEDRMNSINSRIEELNQKAAEFATGTNQPQTTERP